MSDDKVDWKTEKEEWERTIKCPHCTHMLKRKKLKKHIANIHPSLFDPNKKGGPKNEATTTAIKPGLIRTPLISEPKMPIPSHVKKHITEMMQCDPWKTKCDFCPYIGNSLSRHMLTHTEEGKRILKEEREEMISCTYCSYVCKKKAIRKHIKACHPHLVGQGGTSSEYPPDDSSSYLPEHSSSYPPDHSSSYPLDHSSIYPPDHSSSFHPDHSSSFHPDHSSSFHPDHSSSFHPDHSSNYHPDHPEHPVPSSNPQKLRPWSSLPIPEVTVTLDALKTPPVSKNLYGSFTTGDIFSNSKNIPNSSTTDRSMDNNYNQKPNSFRPPIPGEEDNSQGSGGFHERNGTFTGTRQGGYQETQQGGYQEKHQTGYQENHQGGYQDGNGRNGNYDEYSGYGSQYSGGNTSSASYNEGTPSVGPDYGYGYESNSAPWDNNGYYQSQQGGESYNWSW